ncbi:MAG: tetratricopeptide repeat protein [Flavobacteriales bacterium]|nr:tetratricopeptide repeat protein [Flavobacteriales bacterium]MCB9163611.1 tetratricopeptide repeat protein [Flavobacteriales bacterium]
MRFTAYFDLIWEGYLFSQPDSAYSLARDLQRNARREGNRVFEARASELLAATWYVRGDLRTALINYDTALTLHKRNGDQDGMADVMTNMAGMRAFLGERSEALKLYEAGLRIHETLHDSTSIANDLNAMATIHMALGDHALASDLLVRSLRVQGSLGNDRGVATGYANMGALLNAQGEPDQALLHYRKALRIAEEMGDRHMMGKDLEEIGSCLLQMGDTAAAKDHFERSLVLRQELDDQHGIVNVRSRIAEVLFHQREYPGALALFDSCIRMARENDLPWGLGTALVGKAKLLLATGESAAALNAAIEAEQAAREAEELSLMRDATELRYQVLKRMGRWAGSLAAHEHLVQLNDSIMAEENQRAVLRNEYRYNYEKQAYADSIAHVVDLARVNGQHQEKMLRARSRLYLALSGGLVLSVILLGFWLRARLLKRTNAALVEAQDKLVESERGREAAEVRARIARDVHDQLGSDLTKLVMLGGEVRATATHDPALAVHAGDIERIASEANRSLGDIVWAIDPDHDTLAGLVERVRAHAARMLGNGPAEYTIDCEHEGMDRGVDPAITRDIYLIFRETLNNAIKYARANRIQVVFRTNEKQVRFEVRDDGIGFAATNGTSGRGLANIRERARRIGADLSIEGDRGTRVRLVLGLP